MRRYYSNILDFSYAGERRGDLCVVRGVAQRTWMSERQRNAGAGRERRRRPRLSHASHETPAAVVWGTPDLVGGGHILAPTLGTRVILIPDANGRPGTVLKPRGPIGSVTQFGVTVDLGKAQVVELPPGVRERVPDGYIVETIHGTLKNETSDTVKVNTDDFIPLDARGLPSAYELKANPLAMDTRYVKPGETLAGDLTYLVPENARPIAVRWNPVGPFGNEAPMNMVVTLPQ